MLPSATSKEQKKTYEKGVRGHLVQQKGMMQQGMKPRSAMSTADAQLHRPTSRVTATTPCGRSTGRIRSGAAGAPRATAAGGPRARAAVSGNY